MLKSNVNRRERRHNNKTMGLCYECGKPPLKAKSLCDTCNDLAKARKKRRKASLLAKGLCSHCGKNELVSEIFCENCLLKRTAYRQKSKDTVFNHYGGYVCACCGETERVFLTLDHIANNGNEERKITKGAGNKQYGYLIKRGLPPGYQILCWNCQIGKARGGCPHNKA